MATPAWPTPMRALVSKLNLPHSPEHLTDSALFNRGAQRAVACILTSSIDRYSELLRRSPVRIRHHATPWKRSRTPLPRCGLLYARPKLCAFVFDAAFVKVTSEAIEEGARRHPASPYATAEPHSALRSITCYMLPTFGL